MSIAPALSGVLLDLPASWWGLLFQHVAATTDGIPSVAVLSSTCKTLHTLSEELDYSYRQGRPVQNHLASLEPTDPFWRWLAKNTWHVPPLAVHINPFADVIVGVLHAARRRMGGAGRGSLEQQAEGWKQPLRLLSTIPGLQLTVRMPFITPPDYPFISQWLEEHGELIGRLEVRYLQKHGAWLPLEDLVGLMKPCKSVHLYCEPPGTCAPLAGLTQLTSLVLRVNGRSRDDPWLALAALTGLHKLECHITASRNPSPLSALTSLTSLYLAYFMPEGDDELRELLLEDQIVLPPCFSFSNLRDLSTLQQLEVLRLDVGTCTATSLQGLAGLSSLQNVGVYCKELESLQGLSAGITSLQVLRARSLRSLAGIGVGVLLQEVELSCHSVTSLLPLASLSKLRNVGIQCFSGFLGGSLEVFEASSSSLQSLRFHHSHGLVSLQGIEKLTVLEALILYDCTRLTSLKPLGSLGNGVKKLHVEGCVEVMEDVLELPNIQPTADVKVGYSNVREVVLARGVRRAGVGWRKLRSRLV